MTKVVLQKSQMGTKWFYEKPHATVLKNEWKTGFSIAEKNIFRIFAKHVAIDACIYAEIRIRK